eukprot:14441174-Heterocapsa_arctica.AAC.1
MNRLMSKQHRDNKIGEEKVILINHLEHFTKANKDRHIMFNYRSHLGSNSDKAEGAGQPTHSDHGGFQAGIRVRHGHTGQPGALRGG